MLHSFLIDGLDFARIMELNLAGLSASLYYSQTHVPFMQRLLLSVSFFSVES